MDHGFWCVEMHNMACDIQWVVFPNNMVLLSGFSKNEGYINILQLKKAENMIEENGH